MVSSNKTPPSGTTGAAGADSRPTLYGSPRSPFVRKVRIFLGLKGIPFIWNNDSYADLLAGMNPLVKSPTLRCANGIVYFDSPVICEYLEHSSAHPNLIPENAADRLSVKRWEALSDGICDAAVAIVMEGLRPVETERSPGWIAKQRQKIENSLAFASRELKGRSLCALDRITLADVGMYSALCYLDYRTPQIEWRSRYPDLSAFVQSHDANPAFSGTAPY